MTENSNLIARLEALSGQDFEECRQVDGQIALAIGWTFHQKKLPHATWLDLEGKWHLSSPFYTLSVDAATSVIPKDWHWDLSDDGPWARISTEGNIAYTGDRGQGANPAIALLIVAMRAKADGRL